jgi:hypothetical protein
MELNIMPNIIETTVFQFDELSDTAKDVAREWFRSGNGNDDWYDSVYEDATECGKLIGIVIDKIYFSGFSSQGDGACFEGRYSYVKGAVKAIAGHAPQDKKLHAIAASLQETQRKAFYRLEAKVKHSGHYYHEHCTSIETFNGVTGDYATPEQDSEITESLRDFMRWIYRQLENEWNYINSNESVDESIRINEYTFTEDGKRFG